MELLFLEPIFKERIWGGNKLKTDFGYNIPSNKTGECWAISAHPNGETLIRSGKHAGDKLSAIWHAYPQYFATNTQRQFPLMIKILDACDDLSVQVHPDDKFALEFEHDSGKAECWYVLDAKTDARIIYGHTAKSRKEFKQRATNGQWAELLNPVKIKKGDFFDVPTGTVHALGKGSLVLEVQQSSDTTYRLYDYERKDAAGKLRELHLNKAFAVITAPHKTNKTKWKQQAVGLSQLTLLAHNDHFEVTKLELNGTLELDNSAPYFLVSVCNGNASLNGININKGDHFIIPNQVRKIEFSGYATLIIANEAIAK